MRTLLGVGMAERLTTGADHHCVILNLGDRMPRSAVGYELWDTVADAARRLTDAGYEVERRSDIAPGTPDVLVLTEPTTGVALHLFEGQQPSGATGCSPLPPTKLGHVAAFTPQLGQLQSFTKIYWASSGPTPSGTFSFSCGVTPIITSRTSWRAHAKPVCTTSLTRCATQTI